MRQVREDKPGGANGGTQQQPDPNQARRARRGGGRCVAELGSLLVRAGVLCPSEKLRIRSHVFLGEVLVLAIHAIDLPRSAAPQAHRRASRRAAPATQATGSKDGEKSRSRPLARG